MSKAGELGEWEAGWVELRNEGSRLSMTYRGDGGLGAQVLLTPAAARELALKMLDWATRADGPERVVQ